MVPIPVEGAVVMFDETKVQNLLIMVFGVVVLMTAIAVAASSKRARYAETARTSFNVLVGIVLAAIGLGAIGFAAFGGKVLSALGLR